MSTRCGPSVCLEIGRFLMTATETAISDFIPVGSVGDGFSPHSPTGATTAVFNRASSGPEKVFANSRASFVLSATSAAATSASTTESSTSTAESTASAKSAAVESAAVRKTAAISTEPTVTAAKVLACEPVGTTLAEVSARSLSEAIRLSQIALSDAISLSDAIAYVTRRKAARAPLTEIAAPNIALAKTLLNLPDRRALTDIPRSAREPV